MTLSKLLTSTALTVAMTGAAVVPALPTAATGAATSAPSAVTAREDPPQHEYSVHTHRLRGTTFTCGDLALKVTRGTETETTDGDLRHGIGRVSVSRIWRHVRLHGSDGRTYRASGVTAAWFVLLAPDFERPVHGLEVVQVMFRGGPEKSPGWLRERIRWVDKKPTDVVNGPCDFAD
jgi:hypothetical protein